MNRRSFVGLLGMAGVVAAIVPKVLADAPSRSRVVSDGAEFNVLDYGAEGDGVSDDSEAFRRALDAATKTGKKCVLLCPEGTYLLSDTIRI